MKNQTGMTRRDFVKAAAVAGVPLIVPCGALGDEKKAAASERLNLGFIGVGTQNRGHLGHFLGQKDVQVVAVCDVRHDSPRKRQGDGREALRRPGQERAVQGLRGLQRLPRIDWPQGHRRRRHRHARPLARHPLPSRRSRRRRTSTAKSRCP